MSSRATVVIARYSGMETAAMNWMTLWDQCARYISPRKGNILTKNTPGQDQTLNIYDFTAEQALGVAAAGTLTNICPAGEKWFRMQPKNKKASQATKQRFDKVSEIVLDQLLSSNFYEGIHEDFLDAFCFATSNLLEEEGKKNTLNFVNIPVGTFYIEENAEGMVDTVARKWQWTARQAEQKWGREKLMGCKTLFKALTDSDPAAANRLFTFLHFVEPRDVSWDGQETIGAKRPISSEYVCMEDQCIIETSGYYTMPYLVSRLFRSNNEVYGRGPGIQSLPVIRMVNAMKRDILVANEKLVNPGWLMPDDTSGTVDNRPNGITFWDTSNAANKPEMLTLKNQIDTGKMQLAEEQQSIREAFFNSSFQMLSTLAEQKREKTAYEVQQMVAEKLLLFQPFFARIVKEKLNPLLERTVDILARKGMLPPADELDPDSDEYEIVYTSKIALAIKSAQNQAFATMMQLVTAVAPLDPRAVNLVNWLDGLRSAGSNLGLEADLMRSDREIDAMTQAQQEAAQLQQAAETAKLGSEAAKNAKEAGVAA